jgi:hypothetical protein
MENKEINENKYYFSVGAILKNESNSINEWIKHYLHHGVEHFYLINDNSDDNFLDSIKEYIDSDLITLFNVNEPYYLGRQRNLYNRYILPHIKETKWLLMVDLDEYVWSKMDINMTNVLKNLEGFAQLQIQEHLFGSNSHIKQPNSIVKSFTKRGVDALMKLKYFVNSSYEFSSLNIHHADFLNKEYITDSKKFLIINTEYFINNHYCCQSKEFWENVKCTRGDSDSYKIRKNVDFDYFDVNEVEDFDLYNQNQNQNI